VREGWREGARDDYTDGQQRNHTLSGQSCPARGVHRGTCTTPPLPALSHSPLPLNWALPSPPLPSLPLPPLSLPRCVVNHGQSPPTIVMGISAKLDTVVHADLAASRGVPVLRRFTGGGTVVTDAGTLFVSLVCNKADVEGAPLYPREVMKWSEGLYAPVFAACSAPGAPPFSLREHDYCLGDTKVGGNAQAISRDRWVHHTSFLWDFRAENMALLKIPEKRPEYRGNRGHGEFLTPISKHLRGVGGREGGEEGGEGADSRALFVDSLVDQLRKTADVVEVGLETAEEVLRRPQERRSNVWVGL
jgi:lipoate-protein ligase A